ncbi:unnamed protein product [Durusdinium trenchii]|uniref:Uncharacterized protein n=2 Tax=Durusdinium trenchii TaxID=1381693 RepID=A0ABP0SX83_9DINO
MPKDRIDWSERIQRCMVLLPGSPNNKVGKASRAQALVTKVESKQDLLLNRVILLFHLEDRLPKLCENHRVHMHDLFTLMAHPLRCFVLFTAGPPVLNDVRYQEHSFKDASEKQTLWTKALDVDLQPPEKPNRLISQETVPTAPISEIYACNLSSFGALGDGMTDNSKAFRNAIESCGASRGQQRLLLEIPEGTFLTGSFNLSSKMTLRLLKGSRLLGVTDFSAYPLVPPLPSYGINRDWAKDLSLRPAALISGFNLTDVVIEGEEMGHGYAEIDGKGEWWWAKFRRGPLPFGRPSLIQFMYSDHIILRKLILKNPPFWNTHFYASRDIVAERLRIEAPYSSKNTDGINLDSVTNAVVRHCVISTGDDAIAIKSGLNEAGLRFGMPSSHIHLHDLEVRSKCLSIGSEMSGGISDVLVENIHFGDDRPKNRWHGIFIKSSRPRGGSVQNLLFRNITSVERTKHQTKVFIEISMSYGSWNGPEGRGASAPPLFRNFSFRDISSYGAFVVANITGLVDSPIRDVSFERLRARNHVRGLTCLHTYNVRAEGIQKEGTCRPHLPEHERQKLDEYDKFPQDFWISSTPGWKQAREELIAAVFGTRTLPMRTQPDRLRALTEDLLEMTWDLSGSFQINSTVFYAPLKGSTRAVLWHQGHHDCVCPATGQFTGLSKIPGFQQAPCQPGCVGIKHVKDVKLRKSVKWWDLDNVTDFFHTLGYSVFILSMPLVGVNFMSQRSSNWTDHWWFQKHEAKGDFTMRYFCEPVVLSINYALSLGFQEVHLAGLSGGAWTTSMVAAMDPRIRISVQVAGAMPYSMRFSTSLQATGDIGDYEQICNLPPYPFRKGARHVGYGWRKDPGRQYCKVCNYKCQFMLAALESNRSLLQIFHEDDTCCYAAAQRHDEIRSYEAAIRDQLRQHGPHGWFTAAVTDHRKHELSAKDKKLIEAVLGKPPEADSPEWNEHPVLKLGLVKAPSSRGRWDEVFTQMKPWQVSQAMLEECKREHVELAIEDEEQE